MFVETKSRGSKDTVQNATSICILLTQEPETNLEYDRVDGYTYRNHHLLGQKATFPLVYVDVCDITMSKPPALDVRQARGRQLFNKCTRLLRPSPTKKGKSTS